MTVTRPEPEKPDPADEARHWVARLASGSVTEDELAQFSQWRRIPANDALFRAERALWRQLGTIESAFAARTAPSRRLKLRLGQRWRRLPALSATAATVLLAIAAAPELAIIAQADHRTSAGEIREIALPDGSRAVLDTGSAIAVDYADGGRTIRLLSGRAWFDVRHGDQRPFRVAALGGVIEDIGTAFEVDRTTDSQVRVGVTEGMVKLSTTDARHALLLKAGDHARYREGASPARVAGSPANATATWRDGELLVRDMGIGPTIDAIARYRSGAVFTIGDTTGLTRISGTFRTDRPDDALRTIASMRGLGITRLPFGVLIIRVRQPG